MGGGALPPVPDWKSYKVGPHTPELEQVQRMLASMGLKVSIMIKLINISIIIDSFECSQIVLQTHDDLKGEQGSALLFPGPMDP